MVQPKTPATSLSSQAGCDMDQQTLLLVGAEPHGTASLTVGQAAATTSANTIGRVTTAGIVTQLHRLGHQSTRE
jgi:hypothetical protein